MFAEVKQWKVGITPYRRVSNIRSSEYSDAGELDDDMYFEYVSDDEKDSCCTDSELAEKHDEEPEPDVELLCPSAARYKIRASGRKIAHPKFERDGLDFMVDIDPEVEESLGRNFYDEHGASDNEDEPEDDYIPPARQQHLTVDASEKEYLEQALTMWEPRQRAYLRDLTRREGINAIVNQYLIKWRIPIENLLLGYGVLLSKEDRLKSDKVLMQRLQAAIVRCMRSRDRRKFIQRNFKSEDDVLPTLHGLLQQSKKIVVLSGAGISVSCGIPDFRSKDGLYAQLSENGMFQLDDPQQMFDINFFRQHPGGEEHNFNHEQYVTDLKAVFYSFAHQIYPANFKPSPCHQFIRCLEKDGKLLRNYTQNIDTLEMKAGIQKLVQCHGSFATASCIECRARVPGDDIKDDLLKKIVPLCKGCNAGKRKRRRSKKKRQSKVRSDGWESDSGGEEEYPKGIMKPDITFFGEKLCTSFDEAFYKDLAEMDLLLIMGTSLKVSPVSDMIMYVPQAVPIVVINKTPITHIESDMQLLGDADRVVYDLAFAMGYYDVCFHWNFFKERIRGGYTLRDYSAGRRRRYYADYLDENLFVKHLLKEGLRDEEDDYTYFADRDARRWLYYIGPSIKKKVVGRSGLVLYDGARRGTYVREIETNEKLREQEREAAKMRRRDKNSSKQSPTHETKKLEKRLDVQEGSQGPATKRMKLDLVLSPVSLVVEH